MVINLIISKCSPKSMSYLCFIFLCVFLHVWFTTFVLNVRDDINSIFSLANRLKSIKLMNSKRILLWNSHENRHLFGIDKRIIFPKLNCSRGLNCIFRKYTDLLHIDHTGFDAVIFDHTFLKSKNRPTRRSASQLYIFHTIESSYYFPACEVYNDEFFNWTFTYRLDSDVVWNYFAVRNHKGAIVAPSVQVKWQRSFHPVKKRIKSILAGKHKAAAWLVSHCRADSLRDEYLTRLQEHLFHFALKIDVYGECSQRKCINNNCDEMIRKDYYFYMAFENSLAEDYVTEKILHGYRNYAVPIVYGGANYSRFLPAGSYINAREMHPYNLAFAMYQAIQTPTLYETYFKWTNLYTVNTDFKSQHPLCNLCASLYRKEKYKPAQEKFRLWWNGLNGMKWCLSDEYWNETATLNIDARHILNIY